MHDMLEYFWDL